MKLSRDFPFIENGDVYIARLNGTSSTVWQKRASGNVILFKIPDPFVDSFGCSAEWELNVQTQFQTLRLDFMFRLTQPPAATFEGIPYHHNMRSALSGGVDGTLNRELSRIYRVNHVFSEAERRSLMHDLEFYKSNSDADEKWAHFLSQVSTPEAPVARVEVEELVDTMDTIPYSQFSSNALANLHYLRYRRRMNSGKFQIFYSDFLVMLYLSVARNPVTHGHQLDTSNDMLVSSLLIIQTILNLSKFLQTDDADKIIIPCAPEPKRPRILNAGESIPIIDDASGYSQASNPQ